jgi:hypothetical protein
VQIRLREAHDREIERVPAEGDRAGDEPGENDERAAITQSTSVDASFAPSNRPRGMGRVRSARRLPQFASAATASPANSATTITSRNRLMNCNDATPRYAPVLVARYENASLVSRRSSGRAGGFDFRARVMIKGINTITPSAT